MKCQIKDCFQTAKFGIYKTFPDGKKFIKVCDSCDKEIGAENLKEKTNDKLG